MLQVTTYIEIITQIEYVHLQKSVKSKQAVANCNCIVQQCAVMTDKPQVAVMTQLCSDGAPKTFNCLLWFQVGENHL